MRSIELFVGWFIILAIVFGLILIIPHKILTGILIICFLSFIFAIE